MQKESLVIHFGVLSTLFCTANSAYVHHSYSHAFWYPGGPSPRSSVSSSLAAGSSSSASITLGPGSTIVPTVTNSDLIGPTDTGSRLQPGTPTDRVISGVSGQQTASGITAPSSTGSSPPSSGGIALGFNYDASVDFATEFATARNLVGTSGFTSARIYTMIDSGSTNTPISAIQAAIDTGTTLLLSSYCSSGDTNFAYKTEALASAITQYGTPFTDLIVGISVGSEDLYRNSVTTDDNPANINKYIPQTRALLTNANSNKLVGHVDTYDIWTNAASGGLVLPNVDCGR